MKKTILGAILLAGIFMFGGFGYYHRGDEFHSGEGPSGNGAMHFSIHFCCDGVSDHSQEEYGLGETSRISLVGSK